MYCPIGYTLSNNALYDYKGGSGVDTFPGFAGSCDGRIDAGAGNDLFTVAAALDSKAVLNGDAGNDTFTFLTTARTLPQPSTAARTMTPSRLVSRWALLCLTAARATLTNWCLRLTLWIWPAPLFRILKFWI